MATMAGGKGTMNEETDTVFVDSDAFVGLRLPDDAHFERATTIFSHIKEQHLPMITSSWVVAETATVLSHHAGQQEAGAFLRMIKESKFPVVHMTEALEEKAIKIFLEQTKKGTSMVDCGNIAVMGELYIDTIFSFDKVYPNHHGLMVAA
jgi:predicted nucleic acid-binding protein